MRHVKYQTVSFQNPCEASSRSRIFLFSLVYVCMYEFIYLCHASWINEKRYRPEIWYTRFPRPHFLFFRKSDPEGRQPRKTAVSSGFFAYHVDCLILSLFTSLILNPCITPLQCLNFQTHIVKNCKSGGKLKICLIFLVHMHSLS